MTTPYVDIVDARIDPDSPGDFNFTTDVRNNLRHLKERADLVGIHTLAGIHDDFTGAEFDRQVSDGVIAGNHANADMPYAWEFPTGAASDVPTLLAAPDHAAILLPNGGTHFSCLAASKYRMRFGLGRDHTIYAEFRHKSLTSANGDIWLFGFQDASLAASAATCVTTQSNIIAFVQDATANKYKARCAKAAAGVDVATALGNAANWTVLRIEITFSGATKKVEFFVDGVSAGSTTDTTKIPSATMRPFLGTNPPGSTARTDYFDYADFDWTVRPLSN